MEINSVLVFINPSKGPAQNTGEVLRKALTSRKLRNRWHETLACTKVGAQTRFRKGAADLAIVCGGDGTLIQTAHRLRGTGIPIVGINIGYLGFVTTIEGGELEAQIHRVLDGELTVWERTALDVKIGQGKKATCGWAVNESLVSRGDNPHLINLAATIGGRRLTDYRCDGLIVSTPTGSTAYSLAAGGPIISPWCDALVVTPICPHSLTNRSVVVDTQHEIALTLSESSCGAVVNVDGMQLGRLSAGDRIYVNKSKDTVPIAFLPEINYFDILSRKLGWSGNGLVAAH